jgi:hypothetical protein
MKKTIFAALGLICSTVFAHAQAPSGEAVLVTPDNFNRAETDMIFAGGGGREVGRFSHHREPTPLDASKCLTGIRRARRKCGTHFWRWP